MSTNVFFFVLKQSMPLVFPLDRPCATGWVDDGSACLSFSGEDSRSTWESAREECAKHGSDLVVINSLERKEFVKHFMNTSRGAWIGLKKDSLTKTLMWVNSKEEEYSHWAEVELESTIPNEACVLLNTAHGWNDLPCDEHRAFVCEKGERKAGDQTVFIFAGEQNIKKDNAYERYSFLNLGLLAFLLCNIHFGANIQIIDVSNSFI